MRKHVKDYFIPHKENNYAPHSLQKAAMIGMTALVVLSFTASNLLSLLWIGSSWMVSSVLPSVIVDLTNSQRQEDALGSLHRNETLDRAATLKAQHMAENQYFAHYSPQGVSPWYWFGAVDYNFVHAGENLAIHFTDSGEVVDAWMASPSHRANILNGNYTEIGVGTAEGVYEGYPTVYVVQLFGTPAAVAAQSVSEAPQIAVRDTSSAIESATEAVLAESVSVNGEETPSITQAEMAPGEAQEQKAAPAAPHLIITNMESTPYGFAAYSDFMATSTGLAAATVEPESEVGANSVPFYLELAVQPQKMLQMLYMLIGAFVLLCLLLSMLIEIRRQQPVQIAYAVGLLMLMGGLFYIHATLGGGALIV